MQGNIILIGAGEMGGVFARGFLRTGFTVVPVNRGDDVDKVAAENPTPEMVLLAMGETDLSHALGSMPQVWQDKLALLQNELLPQDWLQHGIKPTVTSVWFEKKPGMDFKVIRSSPVYGPKADIIARSLKSIDIAVEVLKTEDELLDELVTKNLYILTSNLAGLKVGGTVGELWDKHHDFMRAIALEVLDIQEYLTGEEFDRERLIRNMQRAFAGDPAHQCMGRSAPARLQRALQIADKAKLKIPHIRSLTSLID